MKSLKELTEKLKKLNTETYFITCQLNKWELSDGAINRYIINILDPDHQKPLRFSIEVCLSALDIKVYLSVGYDTNSPLLTVFKNDTYSEKEKIELKLTLEEIKEFSDSNLLKEFNNFLHE